MCVFFWGGDGGGEFNLSKLLCYLCHYQLHFVENYCKDIRFYRNVLLNSVSKYTSSRDPDPYTSSYCITFLIYYRHAKAVSHILHRSSDPLGSISGVILNSYCIYLFPSAFHSIRQSK